MDELGFNTPARALSVDKALRPLHDLLGDDDDLEEGEYVPGCDESYPFQVAPLPKHSLGELGIILNPRTNPLSSP